MRFGRSGVIFWRHYRALRLLVPWGRGCHLLPPHTGNGRGYSFLRPFRDVLRSKITLSRVLYPSQRAWKVSASKPAKKVSTPARFNVPGTCSSASFHSFHCQDFRKDALRIIRTINFVFCATIFCSGLFLIPSFRPVGKRRSRQQHSYTRFHGRPSLCVCLGLVLNKHASVLLLSAGYCFVLLFVRRFCC